MSDDLERALRAFHNKAIPLLSNQPEKAAGTLHVLLNARDLLRADVERLEKSQEFVELVKVTRAEFSKGEMEKQIGGLQESHVKNFFRQSGYYLDLADGRSTEPTKLIGSYQGTFSQSQIVKRYLAPLEFVTFHSISTDGKSQVFRVPPEGNMHFNRFSIRSFSASELDQLLNQRVNAIFYPWAKVDTGILSEYWFIDTRETLPFERWPGRSIVSLEVKFEYSEFSTAVENVMRVLVLYDWGERESRYPEGRSKGKGIDPMAAPACFHVPFVLTISDFLIDSPKKAPEISEFVRVPAWDPMTGEEIGEEPVIGYYVGYEGTGKFKTFVGRAAEMLNDLRDSPDGWKFLQVGLGFLVKAAVSEGLERLLWHIAAIDALLGEEGPVSTARLTKRLATVLAGC